MKLLTKEILKKAPALYAQDGKKPDEIQVVAKFFTPWTNWTWFMVEYDPKSGDAYGYVVGQHAEMGYFNINELEKIQGPVGLKIERDRNFSATLAEVKKKYAF